MTPLLGDVKLTRDINPSIRRVTAGLEKVEDSSAVFVAPMFTETPDALSCVLSVCFFKQQISFLVHC